MNPRPLQRTTSGLVSVATCARPVEAHLIRCRWSDGHVGLVLLEDVAAGYASALGLDPGVPLGPDPLRRRPWSDGTLLDLEPCSPDTPLVSVLDHLHVLGLVLMDALKLPTKP